MPSGGPRPCPNNGGKRKGAGRKPGSQTKRSQNTTKLAEKLAGEGPLPLQVMLEAMRYYREIGQLDKAAAIARDAAPYEHPRKAAITVAGEMAHSIKLVRDDNFYGNADRLLTPNPGSPAADPPPPGPHESSGLRPALGQDGSGPDGGH